MTTTEQTNHLAWTNVRIRNLLKLHEFRPGGLVTIVNAEDVCRRVRDELVDELMALRAEVAALKAANEAAKQFQPLPRRVEIHLAGHVDD